MDGRGRRRGDVGRIPVAALPKEVVHGSAVGGDDALVAPLSPQNRVDEVIARPTGLSAEAVVGGHHFLDVGLDHQVFEGRKVGLSKIALGDLRVIAVAVPFRARVDGIVLRAGMGLQDRGIRRALQSTDDGHAQLPGQIRVLAVGLHSPSPARVAEDVDVRRPEGDALVLPHAPGFLRQAVLHPRLVADGRKDFIEQRLVERSRHADGLREHRGRPVPGHPVQRLAPPVVSLYAERGHRGGIVHRHGSLLLERHAGHQVRRPLLGRQRTVLVRLCRQRGGNGAERQKGGQSLHIRMVISTNIAF